MKPQRKKIVTGARIYRTLEDPRTYKELAHILNVSEKNIHKHVSRYEGVGLVHVERGSRPHIISRK